MSYVSVLDCEDAIDYVLRRGRHAAAERPDLILLDLNLPRLHGAEVLAEIKRHDALRAIPIVVFTSSDAEQDILQSYQRGANGYVTKVGDLGGFVAKIQAIEQFWFRLVTLP
jgi:CheY-like chemotaxis protein